MHKGSSLCIALFLMLTEPSIGTQGSAIVENWMHTLIQTNSMFLKLKGIFSLNEILSSLSTEISHFMPHKSSEHITCILTSTNRAIQHKPELEYYVFQIGH